jgi:hypothetical protein
MANSMSYESILKWSLLAAVALVDGIWVTFAGFELDGRYVLAIVVICFCLLISIFYFYTYRDQRIQEFAHFSAQIVALYSFVVLFSYLIVSTDAPLVDLTFDRIDKFFGLDWVAWTKWVAAHPQIYLILAVAYTTQPIQAFFCYIYNIHTLAFGRNSEIWWLTFISVLITIAGSGVFPASNPYVHYGLLSADHFAHMTQFLGLREGLHVITFGMNEGIIQLPSFHTILAIIFTYNVRHNRWLFVPAIVLNATVILACPSVGSHYFVDLPAGAVVAIATIWVVRRLGRYFSWGLQPQIIAKPLRGSAIDLTRELA